MSTVAESTLDTSKQTNVESVTVTTQNPGQPTINLSHKPEKKEFTDSLRKPNSIPEMPSPEAAYLFIKEVLEGKRTFDIKNHGKDLVFLSLRYLGRSSLKHINFADLIIQLLEQGVDPQIENEEGEPLLFLAARTLSLSLIQYLINRKVPLNNVCKSTGHGIIHWLVHFGDYNIDEILELLLKSGLDPNLPDSNGSHPLGYLFDHLMTPEQMKNKVEILLRYKLNLDYVNPKGHTILDSGDDHDFTWAPNAIPSLKVLFASADVNHIVHPTALTTAFHQAVKYGFTEIMTLLVGNTTDIKKVIEAASTEMANIGKIPTNRINYDMFGTWYPIDPSSEPRFNFTEKAKNQLRESIQLLLNLGASQQSIEAAARNCGDQIKDLQIKLEKLNSELIALKDETNKASATNTTNIANTTNRENTADTANKENTANKPQNLEEIYHLRCRIKNVEYRIQFQNFIHRLLTQTLQLVKHRTEQQIKMHYFNCAMSNLQHNSIKAEQKPAKSSLNLEALSDKLVLLAAHRTTNNDCNRLKSGSDSDNIGTTQSDTILSKAEIFR